MAGSGKRVAWVELYLDLVFVLAVAELTRRIVDDPHFSTVAGTLGLFAAIWWTWIGFAVLYNRHGSDHPGQRALFLIASVPVAVAAVATEAASNGDLKIFALSMAGTRMLLAAVHVHVHVHDDDPHSDVGDALRRRTARAYAISATLFLITIWIPSPFRYVVWAFALAYESRVIFSDEVGATPPGSGKSEGDEPLPPGEADALDSHHFAERFGLFLIILLGELVIQAGEAAADVHVHSASGWGALVAAVALPAALWWAYFNGVDEIELRTLELSGGSPRTARVLFAVGHMLPAFALVLVAAGVGLLLRHDPPRIAYALTSIGSGLYLGGVRGAMRPRLARDRLAQTILIGATFAFASVRHVLGPHSYLWALAAWTTAVAAYVPRSASKAPSRTSEVAVGSPMPTEAEPPPRA
jgi:low temperature requirement protein LtrA